jgi:hypothetical protein
MKRRITTTQAAINPALEDERPCNGGEALLDDPLMLNQLSYVVAVGTFGPGDDETIDFTPDDIWRGKVANGAHLRIDNRYYGASATSCERPVAGGGKFQAGERALLFLRPDVHQNDGGWEIAGWHTQAYWVAGDNLSYAPMPTLERLRAEAAASVSPEPPANDNLHPGKIALVVLLSAVVACATLYVVSKPGRASP